MPHTEYMPRVKEFRAESLPLLPGLGETLESLVEYPEVVMKHAVKGEYGRWKIDDKLLGKAFHPGNSVQTCFGKVEKVCGDKILADYYQFEYYHIPHLIARQIKRAPEGETWVVTEISNHQIKGWLESNGVLTHSEEVIDNAVRDRKITYHDFEPPIDMDDSERGTV